MNTGEEIGDSFADFLAMHIERHRAAGDEVEKQLGLRREKIMRRLRLVDVAPDRPALLQLTHHCHDEFFMPPGRQGVLHAETGRDPGNGSKWNGHSTQQAVVPIACNSANLKKTHHGDAEAR